MTEDENNERQGQLQASVWVLQREIPYEGFEILGVFSTEANAEAFAACVKDQKGLGAQKWALDVGEEREYESIDGWHTPIDIVWTPEAGMVRIAREATIRSRRNG